MHRLTDKSKTPGPHIDEETDSALEYLLEGHETMPEDRGLFLGETWRFHPSICSYTSDLFYEGKLRSHAGLGAQTVSGPTRFAGSGLVNPRLFEPECRTPEQMRMANAFCAYLEQARVVAGWHLM